MDYVQKEALLIIEQKQHQQYKYIQRQRKYQKDQEQQCIEIEDQV